jgi:hypothetical protein
MDYRRLPELFGRLGICLECGGVKTAGTGLYATYFLDLR